MLPATVANALRFCTLLLSLSSCGKDEPLPVSPLTPPVVAGGLCHSTLSQCLDDSRVLTCQDRIWTELPCSAVCAERDSVAAGCRNEQFDGTCICIPLEGGVDAEAGPDADAADGGSGANCDFTLRRCIDSETLLYCSQPSRVSVQRGCSTVCAALSPPRLSLGCRARTPFGTFGVDDCVCSLAGMPCADAPAPICDGNQYVARCVDELWQIGDCVLECEADGGAQCSSWADDAGAGCVCGG